MLTGWGWLFMLCSLLGCGRVDLGVVGGGLGKACYGWEIAGGSLAGAGSFGDRR